MMVRILLPNGSRIVVGADGSGKRSSNIMCVRVVGKSRAFFPWPQNMCDICRAFFVRGTVFVVYRECFAKRLGWNVLLCK